MPLLNEYLNYSPGPGGTTAFAPRGLFEQGMLNPAVRGMGQTYAKEMGEFVGSEMGGKGLLDSGFMEHGLADSYTRGMNLAINQYLGEQNLFSQWAMSQNAINAQIQAKPGGPNAFQSALGGAAAGAGIGMMFGPGGAGIGAGIGAGVGLLDQWLNLGIF